MARKKESSIVREMRNITDTKYFAWVVIIGGGYMAISISKNLFKGIGGVGNAVGNSVEKIAYISTNSGISNQDYNKGFEISNNVMKAFGTKPDRSWFEGWTEDEDLAIYNLNKIDSQAVAKVVIDIYKSITNGRSLWFDVEDFMFGYQIARINPNVQNWLK